LRQWLSAAGMTQSALASILHVDATQVSRWCNGRAVPRDDYRKRIEEVFQDRGININFPTTEISVFFSTPMAALCSEEYEQDRSAAQTVYEALCRVAPPVFWAASHIASTEAFEVSDIAAEKNLAALEDADAFVYLQLRELSRVTSSLVETGIALATRKPVTIFGLSEDHLPYILRGFGAVVDRVPFGGHYRFYKIGSPLEVVRLLTIHGRELLGLSMVEESEKQ